MPEESQNQILASGELPKENPYICETKQLNQVAWEILVTTPEDVQFVGNIQARQHITPEIGLKIFMEKRKEFAINLRENKDIFKI